MADMFADKGTDEDIGKDWNEIQGKYTLEDVPEPVERAAPEVEAKTEPAEKAAPEATQEAKTDRQRDVDGKFVKAAKVRTKQTSAADQSTGTGEPFVEPAPVADSSQTPKWDINRAPSSWKPTARAEWATLPEPIRAEIHRRETDFFNTRTQMYPDNELGSKMREAIRPYEMMIQAEGGTPERAVADLFRTAAVFRVGSAEQKYQAVGQICRQFGIDLAAIGRAAFEHSQGGGQQPNLGQQQQQFRDPRVDQLLAHQRQVENQRAQTEQRNTETAVQRWMNEVDAQGNPKRQYLGDVINEMSALVPQLRQADPTLTHTQALDAAYDRAIWAHPEVRGLLEKQRQADLEVTRRAENQRQVSDARRAGSVTVNRRASTPSPGKPGTMDQTIAETARTLGLFS